MTRILAGIAALTIMGAAALPLQASAAEQKPGLSNGQSTDLSSRHRGWRHGRYYAHRYWGPRHYWGPRYSYYGYPYGYPYYGYRPYPGIAFGVGPFGFRVF